MRARALLVALSVVAALLQVIVVGSGTARAEEPPTEAVTEAAAQAAARESGKPVRVLSRMGETREVVANPDGSFTETLNTQVVRTREDGRWKTIDTSLQRRSDGELEPAVSSVGLVLSGGGKGPFARLSRAGRELTFTWPEELPKPQLSGDTAEYAGVLKDVDLRVQALADGFRTVIVVHTPEAAQNPKLTALRWAVGGSKVGMQADAAGGLRAVDAAGGGVLFEAPAPLMWDSSTVGPAAADAAKVEAAADEPAGSRVGGPADEELERGPGEGSKVAPLKAEVGAGALTLKPDQGLLTGTGTKFPVFLDPAWTTPRAAAWAMVSSKYPDTSYWKFDGSFSEGMGLCNDADPYMSNCGGLTRKRLFYRFPTTAFLDKNIMHAEFEGYQNHSYSCTKSRVQLWQVKWFGTQTTWNTQKVSGYWQEYLQGKDTNNGGGSSCPASQVIFNNAEVRAAVTAAAQGTAGTIQFGLKAGDENDVVGWKRFTWGAILRVKYNSLPAKPDPATMKMVTGGECKSAATEATAPYVSGAPKMYATINDKDPDERLKGEFEASWPSTSGGTDWAVRWTGKTGWLAKASQFSYQLPTTIPADGRAIRWRVRGIDRDPDTGAEYGLGAWSQYCYLRYDTTKPKAPTVTSADGRYPQSDPEDPTDPSYDGVGMYGRFKFTPADGDVVKYTWSVDGVSWTQLVAKGASLEVDVLPESVGLKVLNVQAFDGANNVSASGSYPFRVKEGRAAKAHWKLDEAEGATVLADARATGGGSSATVHGGTTLGGAGVVGTSLATNGTDGYAATSGSVLDATKSYSVAAWVKLTEKDFWATAVAQDGPVGSSFYLQYSMADDRWAMSTGGTRAMSTTAPTLGEWAHLVGVYDAGAKKARLYVNGEQQGLANFTAPWPGGGDGPLSIGRAKFDGNPVDFFPGSIDDVRAYDRVLSVEEAAELAAVRPTVAGRWKLNAKAGGGPFTSSDDTDQHRDLVLNGQADIGTGAGQYPVGNGGLVLNDTGTGGYAATTSPVLRTNRSFSIAGWAAPAGVPGQNAAVFSQRGNVNSGFTVRYSPSALNGLGGWQIEMPDQDSSGATLHQADHEDCSVCMGDTTPDHLVLTYDATTDTMTLYVNGYKTDTDRLSYKTGVTGFPAAGGLQLGRTRSGGVDGEYFSGVIDDVWAFDGVLSETQIGELFTGNEIDTDPGP